MMKNIAFQEEAVAKISDGILHKLLTFLYTIAHQIGAGIVKVVNLILPGIKIPASLVDPIGVLAILTLFLVLVQAAKKIAWTIIIVGWVLILIRIFLIILKVG